MASTNVPVVKDATIGRCRASPSVRRTSLGSPPGYVGARLRPGRARRRARSGRADDLRRALRPRCRSRRSRRFCARGGRPRHILRPAGGSIGDLALLAGVVWFTPFWAGWKGGPPLVLSLGTLAAGFAFPLLLHLVLAFPSGRLSSKGARVFVVAVYLEAALSALGRALFRDPFFDPNCWDNCTDNVFLVRSLPGVARGIQHVDLWFTAAAAAALAAVCVWRLAAASVPARRTLWLVLAGGIALAAVTIAHSVALYRISPENPSDPSVPVHLRPRLCRRSSCSPSACCGPSSAPDFNGVPWPGSSPTSARRRLPARSSRPWPGRWAIRSSGSSTGCRHRNAMSTVAAVRSKSPCPPRGARSPRWSGAASESP